MHSPMNFLYIAIDYSRNWKQFQQAIIHQKLQAFYSEARMVKFLAILSDLWESVTNFVTNF